MELSVAIIMMISVIFVSVLSLKAFLSWNRGEERKTDREFALQRDAKITELEKNLATYYNQAKNYKHKYSKIRDSYDLDLDDITEDDVEGVGADEGKLSDLAKTLYPKIPPSLASLIDSESFQTAIINTVKKNPGVIDTIIKKITPDNNKDKQGTLDYI